MRIDERPDVAQELGRLKDFQRATVEHVHRRLWLDDDRTNRFLVADEVGLGKTLVARGVIAHAIDHLWDTDERIDVVYICSNSQIARQNLGRLALGGLTVDHADRLTLLPTAMSHLRENKVNFVSFTPGTSFNIQESGGAARERIVLQWLLKKAWGRDVVRSKGWLRFFQGRMDLTNYEAELKVFAHGTLDMTLAQRFGRDVETAQAYNGELLTDALDDCVESFRRLRDRPDGQLSRHRYRLIGQLRALVASAAVESLEPNLVILDEFQRFKDLLDPDQPGAALAHAIFNQPSAKILLLSATPYKMYTLPDEPEGDDHYADFQRTISFLAGRQRAAAVTRDLRTLRETLITTRDRVVAEGAKDAVERELRRVVSRTERLAASPNRDGMLREGRMAGVSVTPRDIRAYASAERIARCVGRQDVFEFWRSSPYLFNVMEGYQVKRQLAGALVAGDADLVDALREAEGLLDWETLRRYQPLDPGNAKMRGIVADTLDRGAWQLLWLPPSLPYYTPAGAYADPPLQAFTKRLVFSAWAVVPKAIAVILSYEAERRALSAAGSTSRAYDAERVTPLLRFQVDRRRGPTGMPVLAALYPSVALARLGDPLAQARAGADHLPADRAALLRAVRGAVVEALRDLPAAGTSGTSGTSGTVDQRWYWAAPFLLDRHLLGPDHEGFLRRMESWGNNDEDDAQTQLVDHVRLARDLDPATLGRRPDDLPDVLTLLAVAGPGVAALRALSRVCGGPTALDDLEIRDSAAYLSWALRSLFNRPEAMALLRAEQAGQETYWRAVLQHCLDGNLQSVLDEYLHVLVESEGMHDKGPRERAEGLREVVEDALTLRATRATIDTVRLRRFGGPQLDTHSTRVHFAARFGRNPTEGAGVQREGQVRRAYNSPFWPFVLATTSVGQEGLDFHQYSHAVVHWNLPGNPVDLEQREGRVHRYKGHAVRRNVARSHGDAAYRDAGDDPWTAMFEAAASERGPEGDLSPYWVFAPPGGAAIERYVPAMPLSKEAARYQRLLRTVGAYRLVMGQPRQEDLLRYLGEQGEDLDWLRIDLSVRQDVGAGRSSTAGSA